MCKIFNCFKKCLSSKNLNDETKADAKQAQQNDSANSKDVFISIDDFAKLDLRIGKIEEAEKVEGSDKLIKCAVNFGDLGTRTIVSGIANFRSPEDIKGKKFVYIVNLAPRKIFGIESQGMLLAASANDEFAMLSPDTDIKEGTKIG